MATKIHAKTLTSGLAQGELICLNEPISFWGGIDPLTAIIHDAAHPDYGASVSNKILVLQASRGSSSGSYILLELIRAKKAPLAIIVSEPDGIICTGALVGQEIYGYELPVIQIELKALKGLKTGLIGKVEALEGSCLFTILD